MKHSPYSLRFPRLLLAGIIGAGTLPTAACREPVADHAPGAEAVVSADSVSGPAPVQPPDAAARPERIFHDLTRFDWYARGEPLVHEGRSYALDVHGPVALDARTLRRVGEYGGVDYYQRDTDARLYVPVYDGYWLGFAPANAPGESSGR